MDRIFILDRSGSMQTCRDDTIGGFNAFIESQKNLGGTMTLVQFDNEIVETYTRVPISQVSPLTRETFVPRASTALLDAIGTTLKKHDTPHTCIILTDGYENASTKFTKAHVKDLVEMKEKSGWVFLYLGANHDAFGEAQGLGISAGRTLHYDAERTQEAFSQLTEALSRADSQFVESS
jgi:hypothetical protein